MIGNFDFVKSILKRHNKLANLDSDLIKYRILNSKDIKETERLIDKQRHRLLVQMKDIEKLAELYKETFDRYWFSELMKEAICYNQYVQYENELEKLSDKMDSLFELGNSDIV